MYLRKRRNIRAPVIEAFSFRHPFIDHFRPAEVVILITMPGNGFERSHLMSQTHSRSPQVQCQYKLFRPAFVCRYILPL